MTSVGITLPQLFKSNAWLGRRYLKQINLAPNLLNLKKDF